MSTFLALALTLTGSAGLWSSSDGQLSVTHEDTWNAQRLTSYVADGDDALTMATTDGRCVFDQKVGGCANGETLQALWDTAGQEALTQITLWSDADGLHVGDTGASHYVGPCDADVPESCTHVATGGPDVHCGIILREEDILAFRADEVFNIQSSATEGFTASTRMVPTGRTAITGASDLVVTCSIFDTAGGAVSEAMVAFRNTDRALADGRFDGVTGSLGFTFQRIE